MDNPKAQLIERLKSSMNVLITVSTNPSVDQLSAAIGLTLLLNKLGKHATAVFSGEIPSTIEFLQPEATLEKNTDSLRDFIIALDKSKADKLRYKVEDKMVKIFITPYKASINENDLEFSQGDFNVDVVLALGVLEQKDLDQAITSHGRILHDATVVSVNTQTTSSLGSINWLDTRASSLCEMLVSFGEELNKDALDAQMATAFLTGIVSETIRFSNAKTTSLTMNVSATLLAAGANQQLVASKLQEERKPQEEDQPQFDPLAMNELANTVEEAPEPEPVTEPVNDEASKEQSKAEDEAGALRIDHGDKDLLAEADKKNDEIMIDEEGTLHTTEQLSSSPTPQATDEPPVPPETSTPEPTADVPAPTESDNAPNDSSKLMFDPPSLGGTLTANAHIRQLDPGTDPMTLPPVSPPLLSRDDSVSPAPVASSGLPSSSPFDFPTAPQPSLQDFMAPSSNDSNDPAASEPSAIMPIPDPMAGGMSPASPSPDPGSVPTPDVGDARDAVQDAILSSADTAPLKPLAALGAQPIDLNPEASNSSAPFAPAPLNESTADQLNIPSTGVTGTEFKMSENDTVPGTDFPMAPASTSVSDPTAPPPVPPPMMPPLPFGSDSNQASAGQPVMPPAENSSPHPHTLLPFEQNNQDSDNQPPTGPQVL